ncbi:hypothetical protein [Halomicrococcus sp. NG-SE-24]|uniref:hypothetical protein n=1 Tax=Halomicrococcus sp. NG-SE-24 TaxID=3436928 RepID=UPI003D96F438
MKGTSRQYTDGRETPVDESDRLWTDGGEENAGNSTLGETSPISQESHGADIEASEEETPVLYLDLEGLFLDLLGLEVDLDEVELTITATSGPRRLLGTKVSNALSTATPEENLNDDGSKRRSEDEETREEETDKTSSLQEMSDTELHSLVTELLDQLRRR